MYTDLPEKRIRQGDIFRDIEYVEDIVEESGYLTVSTLEFPYIVVLSQDCDLESDYRARQADKEGTDAFVESILVCPAYNEDLFVAGEHLVEVGLGVMEVWTLKKSPWKFVKQNRHPRYHYLPGDPGIGTNNMVVDFKHFYTISRDTLYRDYERCFVGSIKQLYREQLSHRFAFYLSRIGVPAISEPISQFGDSGS